MRLSFAFGAVLVSALALCVRSSTPQSFTLLTLAQSGPYGDSGLFISTYHVGAGLNAAVGTRYQARGTVFKYNPTNHTVHTPLGAYAYYLSFAGTVYGGEPGSYPNASYYPMGINVGAGFGGFSFDAVGALVVDGGAAGVPKGFEALAVCYNDKISGISGSGLQLFYRFGKRSARCADVVLRAIE